MASRAVALAGRVIVPRAASAPVLALRTIIVAAALVWTAGHVTFTSTNVQTGAVASVPDAGVTVLNGTATTPGAWSAARHSTTGRVEARAEVLDHGLTPFPTVGLQAATTECTWPADRSRPAHRCRVIQDLVLAAVSPRGAAPASLTGSRLLQAVRRLITPRTAEAADDQEAKCDHAAVGFCDNFENRAAGVDDLSRAIYKHPGWGNASGTGGTVRVVPGEGRNGSKGLRLDYAARGPGIVNRAGDPASGGAGYLAFNFDAGPAQTFYLRFYTKYSANFVWSTIETKGLGLLYGNGSTNPPGATTMPIGKWGSPPTVVQISHVDLVLRPNERNVPIPLDAWMCHEVRVTINSGASVSDGHVEMWINGMRTHNYPNIRTTVLGNPRPAFGTLVVSGYYNCNSSTCTDRRDAHPDMTRWHDEFVGGTERVGCAGQTPG